tara:strand:- start:283 stop:909 length:627 start_codon:yes stop_codon:yes gene_type:complete
MNIETFYRYFLKKIKLKAHKKKKINVMVTGGNSIIKLYNYINTNLNRQLYKKINFFLTDERLFADMKDTNSYIVKKHLFKGLNKSNYKFFEFAKKNLNVFENLHNYNSKLRNIDFLLISYGEDGHIASLFPDLKPLINLKNVSLIYNRSNKYKFRLSISERMLKKINNKFLFFIGKSKKKLLSQIRKENIKKYNYFKFFKSSHIITDG